jgi:indole-3-glycerol phosphate synthase
MAERRFSHAIAEGDGISVVVGVDTADAARAAEEQRAEALIVDGDAAAVRAASALPILLRAAELPSDASVADAYVLSYELLEDEDGRLEQLHSRVLELGLDSAVEVRDEDEVEKALDRIDADIFLLSAVELDRHETPLDAVLDLLAAVPAGKLAIADPRFASAADVQELERAGCDAVIVYDDDVSALVGGPAPEV